MSDGTFRTKRMLLEDLQDFERNATTEESLADIRVRVSGDVAIATYRETYDALVHAKRAEKTIITTDTFLKQSGRWIQIAARSSSLKEPGQITLALIVRYVCGLQRVAIHGAKQRRCGR